jgi:AcrR family transcriptional regulator
MRCALRELERSGLEGFSLRPVGAAAGLSAMAIYRHFENKGDLLLAIGREAFAAFEQRSKAVTETSIDAWLVAQARVYVGFALDDPGQYDACFVLRTQVERVYPEDFRAGKSPVYATMVERIRAAQAAGRMRAADAVELALLLWAQLHGLVMLQRAGRFSMPRPDFIALCERATLRLVEDLLIAPKPRRLRNAKRR